MRYIFLIICIFLVGCSNQPETISQEKTLNGTSYESQSFILKLPADAQYKFARKDGSFVFSNRPSTFQRLEDEYYIGIYENLPTSQCQSIGTYHPKIANFDEILTVTGKIDYPLDYDATPLLPDCRAFHPFTTSYILCSEKDNAQVAICVTQVTEDSEMVQKIFSAFHWKE